MLQVGGHGTHHCAQTFNMFRHLGAGLPELAVDPALSLPQVDR